MRGKPCGDRKDADVNQEAKVVIKCENRVWALKVEVGKHCKAVEAANSKDSAVSYNFLPQCPSAGRVNFMEGT